MEDTSTNTQIIDLGKLSGKQWPGHVSAEGSTVSVDQVMSTLDNYYVAESPTAKTRCIDGRNDPQLDEAHLGAQVPGGAPGAALAYRLGVDRDDLTRGTFYNDAESMIDSFLRLGLSPGGHRDTQSTGDLVGCGAIDGMDAILANLTNSDLIEDHKRLVRALLGDEFNRDHYLRVLGAGLVLRSRSDDYFRARGTILDLLEQKAPGSVSTLDGTHNEGLMIVNFVPGTTLASNRFTEENDIQAFGYDLWRSKQLARSLFPLPAQQVDYERFVMARVMITIATLMTLTDGTQRLLVRLPVEVQAVDE